MKSMLRTGHIAEIFPAHSSKMMHARLARLSVLFEDLRLEAFGLLEESLSERTQVKFIVQKVYFLRRSIATLLEIAEAVRLLENDDDFRQLMSMKFPPEAKRLWDRAQGFFESNEALLQKVRNDVGGHFGSHAAIYSIENLQSTATGMIEFANKSVKLHFVSEIAAIALLRHVPGTDTESKIRYLIELVLEGHRRSNDVVSAVITFYIWERFGH